MYSTKDLLARLPILHQIGLGFVVAQIFAVLAVTILPISSATAQMTVAYDPVAGLDGVFGLGGRTCKQYDDTGRLYLYSEGLPSIGVISWLQRSDGGTKSNVPMPQELIAALAQVPACMPGKHHAALTKD